MPRLEIDVHTASLARRSCRLSTWLVVSCANSVFQVHDVLDLDIVTPDVHSQKHTCVSDICESLQTYFAQCPDGQYLCLAREHDE